MNKDQEKDLERILITISDHLKGLSLKINISIIELYNETISFLEREKRLIKERQIEKQ